MEPKNDAWLVAYFYVAAAHNPTILQWSPTLEGEIDECGTDLCDHNMGGEDWPADDEDMARGGLYIWRGTIEYDGDHASLDGAWARLSELELQHLSGALVVSD